MAPDDAGIAWNRDVVGSWAGNDAPSAWPVWGLIALLAAARAVSFCLLKEDAAWTLAPRSLVGGGFQRCPALIDLLAPVVAIAALLPGVGRPWNLRGFWRRAAGDAALFLLFPLAAGAAMFAFEGAWHASPNLTAASLLRWAQFVLGFLAWNLVLDRVRGRRARAAAALVLAASLGVLADETGSGFDTVPLLLSVGFTLVWVVLGLRRSWREQPMAALAAAAMIGAVSVLVATRTSSNSEFVLLLSLLSLPAGALAVHARSVWSKAGWLAAVVVVGLLCSLAVPRFLPADVRAQFLDHQPQPLHSELVEGIIVTYDDPAVREVAVRLAHVLAAANAVSRETYGVSPDVNELEIRGFDEGGFHGVFPHRIEGNLPSQSVAARMLDARFLNGDPATSIDFPDPVNAILHEYSHLYGTVPYDPWVMGAAADLCALRRKSVEPGLRLRHARRRHRPVESGRACRVLVASERVRGLPAVVGAGCA
jgi:hypothetical protein